MSLTDELDAMIRRIVREEIAAQKPAAPPNDGERLLTTGAAAERAGVSERTVARWIADGLPTRAVPGRVAGHPSSRIRQADLDAWLKALPSRRRGSKAPTSLQKAVAKRLAGKAKTTTKRKAKAS